MEDSEHDAALLVRVLRQGGYEVDFARVDSASAMAGALEAGAWDMVIGDFSMPGFNTPAALRLLRERGLDLPFIIVSGTMSQDVAVQMMRVGAQDFLPKDEPARLLPTVERELRALADRRALRAAEAALRSGEESVRLLLATGVRPTWVYDLETLAFLEVNAAAVAQFGSARETFLTLRLTDIWPSEAVARLHEGLRQPDAGVVRAGPWPHRLHGGRRIDVEVAAHALRFAGRAAGLLVATAVTERTRQQESRQVARILTQREREVLELLVQGVISNRELAARLVVSENTVRFHLRNILMKLHLQNRAQVVAYALRHGLVDRRNNS